MIFNLTKTEKDKAQITIYGPIKDFSSWFSSGGYSPDRLMQDLDELQSAKEITVRINSGGGSAFAGMAIFELLRAHGAKITTRIDGVAASAASIIAMAGDRIIMGTGAMMMVHNPWMRVEGEAKDMRAAADVLDRVGESLINVYASRTKKSREELKSALDKTTWMTAEESLTMGFADEIDKKFAVSASVSGGNVVFNDQTFSAGIFAMLPPLPATPTAATPSDPPAVPEPPAQASTETPQQPEGDDTVKDLAELQAKHPDIYQAAVQAGAEQERARMKSIDEIANTVADDMVAKAKYESPITAAELAFQALKADVGKGIKHIQDRQQELEPNAGVKPGAQPEGGEDKAAAEAAVIDMIAASANKGREAK
jgi:ATP-dependent Clp endopeptidase proteolytic subunit ClpP